VKGFWESHGGNNRGRVEHNERWAPEAANNWNTIIRGMNLWKFGGEKFYIWMIQRAGEWYGDRNSQNQKRTRTGLVFSIFDFCYHGEIEPSMKKKFTIVVISFIALLIVSIVWKFFL